ncbi:hypothetical protein DXC11_03360 [Firmicutes bacterium OM08-11AC]|jgi:hypothetical protein|uniref:Uncharacterized protein n=2 Tax=unclassified Caudoviricetes TaxID=2788787 RepID=A0A8S5Q112_9CAUD|nr:hypothetical protein DXC11_03360 [Firmicutes bacterium OM08-11AC]DAD82041.1 MAG TPA: hypothetical protein [Siphoviridae sp. ctkL634]DAE12349.1 MAG TPA: hypothetical protein [Siphoviridae sp. ctG0D7]
MKTEQYYMDKLLKMGDAFTAAVIQKNWFEAKYLYDKASAVTVFLEAPQEIREKLFGRYNEERDEKEQGAFDDRSVAKVMKECLIKNNLGFECMVYRIPGEAGYFGARPAEDGYYMPANQNPAYFAQ